MASLNFNANDVAPSESFDTIPAGDYMAQILASEMRPTKAGTGQFLWLEHEILDGEYKGRKLWNQLNIINPNQTAVDIANRQLSAICHAVGELNVSDSEQLHFKPLVLVVKVKPADGNYSAKNEIGNYKSMPGAGIPARTQAAIAPTVHTPARPVTAAPQSSVKAAPWNRSRVA